MKNLKGFLTDMNKSPIFSMMEPNWRITEVINSTHSHLVVV